MSELGQVRPALPQPEKRNTLLMNSSQFSVQEFNTGSMANQIGRDGSSSRHQYFTVFFPVKNNPKKSTPKQNKTQPNKKPHKMFKLTESMLWCWQWFLCSRYLNGSWNWLRGFSLITTGEDTQKDFWVVWAWSHQLSSKSLPEERVAQAVWGPLSYGCLGSVTWRCVP